jgi:hypothetical protein
MFCYLSQICGKGTVEFWRAMGINYSEKMLQVFFLLFGIGAMVFSLLFALSYLKPQGGG